MLLMELEQVRLVAHFYTLQSDGKYLYLYAGGGEMDKRGCERYDPTTNTWTVIPNMRTARQYFATVVMDDKIFAIGGSDGNTVTSSVECFDKRTSEWFVYLLLQNVKFNFESQLNDTFSVKMIIVFWNVTVLCSTN
jgi:hypothetical protein